MLSIIRRITLHDKDIFGADYGLLVGVSPLYAYENNIKTDKIIGMNGQIICPGNGYEKINCKVEGILNQTFTPELIAENGGAIAVKPINFTAKIYVMNGEVKLSCKCTGFEIVKK